MGKFMLLVAVLGQATLLAAPVAKDGQEPVAEGFPAWKGVVPKNYLMGREITDSDLRHRVAAVIEVKADETLHAQFVKSGEMILMDPLVQQQFGVDWTTRVLPREEIVLLSVRGGAKNVAVAVQEALKVPKGGNSDDARMMSLVRSLSVPVYADVVLSEEVNSEGRFPFVYVLGPAGKDPVYKGVLDDKGVKEARTAFYNERKKLSAARIEWTPLFGSVPPDRRPQVLVKALEKGKAAKVLPLDPIARAIQKDVVSKDVEKARDAQIVYDAIGQFRSDLLMRIKMEVGECPHRAYYDVQELLKYWPSEKKRLESVYAKFKAVPEAEKLAKMFIKIKTWEDPEFSCKNAGEVKKIVAELNKMKKDLGKLKDSKVVVVQNGALLMDMKVDELIAQMPTKVAGG